MREKVLKKDGVAAFLARLIAAAKTVAPVRKTGGFFMLEPITSPEQAALDCTISYYSPKEFLLPPFEPLLRYRLEQGQCVVEGVSESEPLILFGLHPCDINALWMLDAAFNADQKDDNYLSRRKNVTIIGLDCLQQCDEFSFCHDMKTDTAKGDYDLLLTDIGDAYFVRVATERGAQLLGAAPDPSPAQRSALAKRESEKAAAFSKRIEFDTDELPERLEKSYDSLIWNAVARRCYSCGSCNIVCPTCYCFNIVDKVELNLTDGERQRYQDSCQLKEFAQVAGGENFRPERGQRLRHRFFRKGKFIKELFGRPGCVGCGRCNRACTSKISIIATYNQLKGGA